MTNNKTINNNNKISTFLVPIDDRVKIGISNFRIALEKSQPDIIYKVCLEILQQYSFFNVFIRTADAPEIYMQQFWHTIHYNLSAKAYLFTIDDQIFEVKAYILHIALHITSKYSYHPFTQPPPEKEIIFFINKLGYSEPLTTISAIRINNMYQRRTLMTMINKCLIGKDIAYDQPRLPMLYGEWSQVRMLTLLNSFGRISGSKLIQGKTANRRRSYYLLLDSQSSLSNTFSPRTTTYPRDSTLTSISLRFMQLLET
ncbi:hypothetical protein Tco_1422512 [Tanacetum coccineum]